MNNLKFHSAIKGLILFCLVLVVSADLSAQGSKSVVRIIVDNKDAGTGFVFNSNSQVVTALHVVAGSNNIVVFAESTGKRSSAKITKAHKESDLALLTLTSELGVSPLNANTSPNLAQEHTIWGYPRDVATKQGDVIRFSKSENSNPTLNDILKSGDLLLTRLKNQGYPLPSVQILRVGSIIQPGHSGAPIMDNDNKVVGVADGGLYEGTARINWAVQAQYLSLLVNEGINPTDPGFPAGKSAQKQLFGNQNPESNVAVRKTFTSDHELYFVMTVPLGEIYDYSSEEDKEHLDFYLESFEENWRDYKIDVYEDVETGATISVPFNSTITYDAEKNWYSITSKEIYQMIVKIEETDSWADAIEEKNNFVYELNNLNEWEMGPEDIYPPEEDEEFLYYDAMLEWETYHSDESQKAQMSAALNIDYFNFFGTVYLTHDIQQIENFDDYYFLEVCLQLATFPVQ